MPLGAGRVALLGAAGSGAAGLTAFGGIITQYVDSGTTYRVHTFRGSGKFFVSSGAADCDVLVIGGGGGGSSWDGSGGGGGGGVAQYASQSVEAGTYAVVVGTGGYQAVGVTSTVSGLTLSVVGGGIGGSANAVDNDGACGGGGGSGSGTTGLGATGTLGYDGGDSGGYGSSKHNSGGGGGMGSVGAVGTASSGVGGVGGNGLAKIGVTASTVLYGGGGGGGGLTGAAGGTGGGGHGQSYSGGWTPAGPRGGVPNSGGGGTGGWNGLSRGGAGIVVIRYAVAA